MLFHLQMVFSVLCNGEYNYTWRRGKYLTEIVMAHCNVLSWHAVNRMCKNWGPSYSAINTMVRLKLSICAKQPRCITIWANLLIMSSVHAWCCLYTEKYLQISNGYFNTCTVDLLLFLYYDQQIHNYLTNYHTATCLVLSCHPQGACNQCLANLHKYFKCRCSYFSL
jgi:hypothetical protein